VSRHPNKTDDYFLCEHCGAELPASASFCRECGASEDAGWHSDEDWPDVDVPAGYHVDDEFDYNEFIDTEFPSHGRGSTKNTFRSMFVGIVLIVLCIAILMWTVT